MGHAARTFGGGSPGLARLRMAGCHSRRRGSIRFLVECRRTCAESLSWGRLKWWGGQARRSDRGFPIRLWLGPFGARTGPWALSFRRGSTRPPINRGGTVRGNRRKRFRRIDVSRFFGPRPITWGRNYSREILQVFPGFTRDGHGWLVHFPVVELSYWWKQSGGLATKEIAATFSSNPDRQLRRPGRRTPLPRAMAIPGWPWADCLQRW